MTGAAIGTSLGYGFAGTVSRAGTYTITATPVALTSDPIAFGEPVILNSDNTVSSCKNVTITAANFGGVAVAEVKQNNTYTVGATNATSGQYTEGQPLGRLIQGTISVICVHGTPTAGGAVYVRKTLDTDFPDEVIGDFRADADGSNTVQLTNCTWKTGLQDANGVAELFVRTANN